MQIICPLQLLLRWLPVSTHAAEFSYKISSYELQSWNACKDRGLYDVLTLSIFVNIKYIDVIWPRGDWKTAKLTDCSHYRLWAVLCRPFVLNSQVIHSSISIVWSRTATPLDQRCRKPKLNLHSAYAASARTKVGNTANCAGQGVMFHLAICTCVIYCHICCIGCLYLFVLSGMEGALQRMWRSQRARHPPICCTWIRSRHVWESRQHVCDIWQDRLAGRGVFHAPRVGDSPGEPCQAWAQMYRRSSNNDFFDCRDNNSSAGYLDVDCEWVHRYLSDVWGCFLFKPGHQIRSFSGAKKLMGCVILTWCKFFKWYRPESNIQYHQQTTPRTVGSLSVLFCRRLVEENATLRKRSEVWASNIRPLCKGHKAQGQWMSSLDDSDRDYRTRVNEQSAAMKTMLCTTVVTHKGC